MKNAVQLLIILTLILGCKDNLAQHKEIELKTVEKAEQKKDIDKEELNIESNSVDWVLIDVTRFFDNPIIDSDYEIFKNKRLSFKGDTIVIDSEKAKFSVGEIDTHKRLGKGSLYEYFTEYLSNKYHIDISEKYPFLNISDENAFKEPFRKYFFEGSALYINDYLFFYTNDDYLLTYKIKNPINFNDVYNSLPYVSLPLQYSYDFLNEENFGAIPTIFQKKLNLEKYDSYFRGAKLPKLKNNKIIPSLIYVNDITGQSALFFYTFTENFDVLDKLELYYSYDIDSGNVVTTYSIDKDYIINIQK